MQTHPHLGIATIAKQIGAGCSTLDNWPESFFATLKKQAIHGERFLTRQAAKQHIFEYIECYYNRVHRLQLTAGRALPILKQRITKVLRGWASNLWLAQKLANINTKIEILENIMQTPTSVLIIDDHALFRRGVRQMISADPEFLMVGEAASGTEGIALVEQLKPDLVLIDLNMKGMNGIQTLTHIKEAKFESKCIVLTVSDAEVDLLEALRAGADGYLLKDMEPEDLCANLKKAMSGVTVLQESLTEILKNALIHPTLNRSEEEISLTEREREILECLANGLNNKTIARALGISDTTVKVHIKHLLSKLKLTSRLEAAVWAHRKK